MDWKNVVQNTEYAEHADCVAERLDAANISTLLQLQNSTGKLGHICQVDIYALVAAITKVFSEGLPAENETETVSAEAEPEVELPEIVEPEELSFTFEDEYGENEK